MVLLPLVCSTVGVPVVAAGGIGGRTKHGRSIRPGAEAVQMGTRMVSAEITVHANWKASIIDAKEPIPFSDRFGPGPALRALRTAKTRPSSANRTQHHGRIRQGADYISAATWRRRSRERQVAGRINEIKPAARILSETMAEFEDTIALLASDTAGPA